MNTVKQLWYQDAGLHNQDNDEFGAHGKFDGKRGGVDRADKSTYFVSPNEFNMRRELFGAIERLLELKDSDAIEEPLSPEARELLVRTRDCISTLLGDQHAHIVTKSINTTDAEGSDLIREEEFEPRELYKDRPDKSVSAVEFLRAVWGDEVDKGTLYQFQLQRLDRQLLQAVKNWCNRNGVEIGALLPPKSAVIDRLAASVEVTAGSYVSEQVAKALRRRKK